MTPERILLVRHGETDWNREGRLQGWGPTPLNDRGREQARRVGEALATEYDIDRIVASDSFRTRETTEHIRDAGIEPEPTFDPAWRERGLGVYQGFTRAELNDRFPAFAMDAGALSLQEEPEGGETVAYSISNADPPSGNRVLAAARATDGGVLAVDDEAILDARRALAERAGLFVESACATSLAGARVLSDRGELGSDEEVVLVATGTGYTERGVDEVEVDARVVSVPDLDGAVAGLFD